MSLETRTIRDDLIEVFKFLNRSYTVDADIFFEYDKQGLPFETIDRSIMQIDRLEALGVIDFSIASLPGQLFIKVPK